MFVELALASGSEFLITRNGRHYSIGNSLLFDSFTVVTPAEFLTQWRKIHAKGRNLLTIRVPEDLKVRIEKYSAMQGVSIDQFAMCAFAKELGELESSRYFTHLLRNKEQARCVGQVRRRDEQG
jgi:hypothetical protein